MFSHILDATPTKKKKENFCAYFELSFHVYVECEGIPKQSGSSPQSLTD